MSVYDGWVKLITAVYWPFVVAPAMGRAFWFSDLLFLIRLNVKATSAAVKGLPSLHLTLCRSWAVRVLPPFDQA